MKKTTARVLSLVLCLCLLSGTGAVLAEGGGTEEVIYASLTPSGEVESVYAVVTLEGETTHCGTYSAVKNLTDTTELKYENGAVTTSSSAERFYYQGELSEKELPWTIRIGYFLDGKEISPDALAGRSGALEIRIHTSRNEAVSETFYRHYMLQITLTLDPELCSEIDAPGATVASSGSDKSVTFTVLPNSDGDLRLKAEVESFRMDSMTVAAVPYDLSSAMGDASELTDGLTRLTDAVSILSDGADELAKGVKQLRYGAESFGAGLSSVAGGSGDIQNGSAQIQAALAQMSAALSGGTPGEIDLSSLAALPAGLRQAATGLRQASAGLSAVSAACSEAYPALDSAIESIPGAALTQEQIAELMALAPGNEALGTLVETYTAAQTAKAVWGQTKAAFEAAGTQLPTITAAVDTVAGSLEDTASGIEAALSSGSGVDLSALTQLSEGLNALSAQYSTFHTGLVEYTNGVSSLNSGYYGVLSGIKSSSEGLDSLADGASELDSAASGIPEQVFAITGGDGEKFEPVSFLSEENDATRSVQFVLTVRGIDLPVTETPPVEEAPLGFFAELWQRILDLFR